MRRASATSRERSDDASTLRPNGYGATKDVGSSRRAPASRAARASLLLVLEANHAERLVKSLFEMRD